MHSSALLLVILAGVTMGMNIQHAQDLSAETLKAQTIINQMGAHIEALVAKATTQLAALGVSVDLSRVLTLISKIKELANANLQSEKGRLILSILLNGLTGGMQQINNMLAPVNNLGGRSDAEELQRWFDGWFSGWNINLNPFGKRSLDEVTPEELQRWFDGWFSGWNINLNPFGKRSLEEPTLENSGRDWTDNWFSNIHITIPWPFGKRSTENMAPEELQRWFDNWFNGWNVNLNPFGKRNADEATSEELQRWFDGWFNNWKVTIKPGKRNADEATPEELQRWFDNWFNGWNVNLNPFGKRNADEATPEELQRWFDGWFSGWNVNLNPFGKRSLDEMTPEEFQRWFDNWFSNWSVTIGKKRSTVELEKRLLAGWGQNWTINGKPLSQLLSSLPWNNKEKEPVVQDVTNTMGRRSDNDNNQQEARRLLSTLVQSIFNEIQQATQQLSSLFGVGK